MSRGVNKAIILGNLTKDVDVRHTSSGSVVAGFSIATNESWKDKNTGEQVDKAEFHNITAFGKLGEICGQYLKKGMQVYVEGKIETQKYQDNNGVDKYSTKIIINELQMLGGKSEPKEDNQHQPPPAPHPNVSGGVPVPEPDIPFIDPYKFNWRVV